MIKEYYMKITYEPPNRMNAIFTKEEVQIIDINHEGKWQKFAEDKMRLDDYEMD